MKSAVSVGWYYYCTILLGYVTTLRIKICNPGRPLKLIIFFFFKKKDPKKMTQQIQTPDLKASPKITSYACLYPCGSSYSRVAWGLETSRIIVSTFRPKYIAKRELTNSIQVRSSDVYVLNLRSILLITYRVREAWIVLCIRFSSFCRGSSREKMFCLTLQVLL